MRWNVCITLMKQLTIFNSLQLLGFFMRVLHAFCRHSNIILIHFYWLLLLESVLRFLVLLSRVLRKPVIWILSKFNWLVVTWCRIWVWESRNRLLTVLYFFFFCLLVLCFCVAPSRVFFECVSCKLFRWYLLILIGLLTCILLI